MHLLKRSIVKEMQCSLQFNNYTESRDVTTDITIHHGTLEFDWTSATLRRQKCRSAVSRKKKTACEHFLDSILAFIQDVSSFFS